MTTSACPAPRPASSPRCPSSRSRSSARPRRGWPRLLGPHRLTLVSLVGVAVGLFGRSQVDGVPAFLALSLLALAGMATANVLLPSLVRLHFPDRVGTITAVYTTALAVGLTAASVLTVPVSEQYDGWRTGLAVWAATAAIAVIPWLAAASAATAGPSTARRTSTRRSACARSGAPASAG